MNNMNLTPEIINQAITHMNTDHKDALLNYAHHLVDCPWAKTATLISLNRTGLELLVSDNSKEETHRIEFPEPVTDAQTVRLTLVKLAQQADKPDGIKRIAKAQVTTPNAPRFMKALCNHFDRKAEGSYEGNQGTVKFAFGHCILEATETALLIQVEADSEQRFQRIKHVLGDHVVRFGQKEGLQVSWVDS